MPPVERNTLRAWLVMLRILHLAMCASLAVYLLMLFMVISSQKREAEADRVEPAVSTETPRPPAEAPSGDLMTIVFVAMSAMSAVALLVVRKKLMPRGAETGRAEALAGGDSALSEQLSGPQKKAIARLVTASIVGWALAESVAIYGLILAFLYKDVVHYLPFAAGSLVLLLVMTPRRAQLEGVARAAAA